VHSREWSSASRQAAPFVEADTGLTPLNFLLAPRMQLPVRLLSGILLSTIIGCSNQPLPQSNSFDQRLAALNNQLQGYAVTRKTARTELTKLSRCHVKIHTTWPAQNALSKGYASVKSQYVLDLERSIREIEFLPAHDVKFEKSTQRWSAHFRMNFLAKVSVKNTYLPIGSTEVISEDFDAELMTLDAAGNKGDTDNLEVLRAFNELIAACNNE
jgi:hypothetical protein